MKKYLSFILIVTVLISCRKGEDDKIDGPDLYDVYGDFGILTTLSASQTSVDFAGGQDVYFNCELTKIVDWELTITGQTSGSQKIISGTSKVLDEVNTLWNGSTTYFPIFRAETCDIMLSFEGETDTLLTTVIIDQPKVNNGFVVADFESGWNNGWSTFIQSGANMDFSIKTDAAAPQNDGYYNMQGTVNWDWLIGLIDFNASAYGETTLPLSSNGDNLYFNALVYGESGLPNTLAQFRFDEDENEDGSFDVQSEDQYSYEFPIDWEGWRLISIKYSDLDGGGNGNGNFDPDKLNKVSFLHLADPSSGFAKSGLDYIIFTENAPLQP